YICLSAIAIHLNNFSKIGLPQLHAYYVLFSSILILVIVFWNIQVCLAVLRKWNLQTTTSYLVISLAVADLLVAIVAMPRVVYLEVCKTLGAGMWKSLDILSTFISIPLNQIVGTVIQNVFFFKFSNYEITNKNITCRSYG
uniref:G-protein coupled receptors family 1 profile domain-containing protein n=1 Tax=Pseudonaja textilis TaxID=8673 RepID=A0A670YX53_PSETE